MMFPNAPRASKTELAIEVKGQRSLRVEQWVGAKSGPRVFISAGMHGDEINGLYLLQKIKRALNIQELAGSIIFVPVLNTSAYRHNSRYFQPYKADLNRSFPGNPTGSPVEVLAHTIFTEITQHCQAGIDLHDAGNRNVLVPHVRLHTNNDLGQGGGSTLERGRLAGTGIIMKHRGEPGMFAIEAARLLKKPIITLEVGGGELLREEHLKEGADAVVNVLKSYNMLPGPMVMPRYQFVLEERTDYTTRLEGIASFFVEVGQPIHTGDLLARVTDPLTEEEEDIISKDCGVVIALKPQSRVGPRTAIASILQFGLCPTHPTTRPNVDNEHILINDPGPRVRIATEGTLVHRLPLIMEKEHQ